MASRAPKLRDSARIGSGIPTNSTLGALLAPLFGHSRSSTLAIWERQRYVCPPPIRSKGGEFEAPTLSAPVLARKFAVLRNRPLSGDSSPSSWRCPFGSVYAPPPRTARRWLWPSKASETFCGSVQAGNPQKVSQAFVDPLTDALCRTPKWLKSSLAGL